MFSHFWHRPGSQDGNPSKSSDQKRNRLLRGVYKQHFHRRDGSAGSKGAPRGCSLGPRPARTALNGSAMAAMQHFRVFAGRVPTFCRQEMRIPARECTQMMRFLHISTVASLPKTPEVDRKMTRFPPKSSFPGQNSMILAGNPRIWLKNHQKLADFALKCGYRVICTSRSKTAKF